MSPIPFIGARRIAQENPRKQGTDGKRVWVKGRAKKILVRTCHTIQDLISNECPCCRNSGGYQTVSGGRVFLGFKINY